MAIGPTLTRLIAGAAVPVLVAGPLAVQAQSAANVFRIGLLGTVPLTDPGTARIWADFSLEPHEVVTVTEKADVSGTTTTRSIAADDSWFTGSPYAVPEEVFDEHSLDACSLSPDSENG